MTSRLIKDVVKHQTVVTLPAHTSVRDAAMEMAQRRIGAVLVVEGGSMVGIFTERDGLFRVLAQGLDPATTPLAEVMTSKVMTITPERPLLQALHIMHENGFRHLPVVQGGVPRGIISIRDALDYELVHFLRDIEKKEALAEVIAM